jgi:hypothetical protein
MVAVKSAGLDDTVLVNVAGHTVAASVLFPEVPSTTRPCTLVGYRLSMNVVLNPVPAESTADVSIRLIVPFPMLYPAGLADPRAVPPTEAPVNVIEPNSGIPSGV